jgi:hypothetical protein
MTRTGFIDSPRARVVENGDKRVAVHISRLETDGGWSLRIVADNGSLTVWDEIFASDEAALDGGLTPRLRSSSATFCAGSA